MEKNSFNYEYLIKKESNDIEDELIVNINKDFCWGEERIKDFGKSNSRLGPDRIMPSNLWGWGVDTDANNNAGWKQIEMNSMRKDRIRDIDDESYYSNLLNSLPSKVTCEGCSGFKSLDEDHKAIIEELRDLKIFKIEENFTSRELVKILIYFTKVNKFDRKIKKFAFYFADGSEIYKCLYKHRKLSPKGIKYWMLLSKEKPLELLFKKYKPWSIHTIYKRLFSNMNLEEVYQVYANSPELDATEIIKIINQKRKNKIKSLKSGYSDTAVDNNKYDSDSNSEDKRFSMKEFKKIKKISKVENKSPLYMVKREEETGMIIENQSPNSMPNVIIAQSNYSNVIPHRQFITPNPIYQSPVADSSTKNKGVVSQDNSNLQINIRSLFENASSSKGLVNSPDRLSDLYDDNNNKSANRILSKIKYN